MMKIVFALITLGFLLNAPLQAKENANKVQKDLKNIQTKIQKLEKNIYHTQSAEKNLNEALSVTEKEMGECAEKLRTLTKALIAQEAEIVELKKTQTKLNHQNSLNQVAMQKLIRTSLAHKNQEKLKLFLSQNNMTRLSRLDRYYQYFSTARANQIRTLQQQLSKVKTLEHSLTQAYDQKKALQQDVLDQQKSLEKKKIARSKLIGQLSLQLSQNRSELTQLQQQEKYLEQVFQTLQKKLKSADGFADPSGRFAKMKRKLYFPIQAEKAKLSVHPLLNKNQALKTYIPAPAGTPVLAIHSGKVVFAEWLRGIGLLIILDHGNGYMSLYGNNQKLYKSLGEVVNPGEMIARVGESGGHAQAGLYFEIRKDGKSIDPTSWFKQS